MTQDYPLFEHWYRSTDWLLDRCEQMPRNVRFTLSSRIAELALDTLDLITQAIYAREKRPLLQRINLNLERLRILLRLCHDRRLISTAQLEFAAEAVRTAGAMCGGWLKKQPSL
jgi:hypothetical protein